MWLSQNMVPESVNELNMTHVYIKHTYIGENTNILAECFLTKRCKFGEICRFGLRALIFVENWYLRAPRA